MKTKKPTALKRPLPPQLLEKMATMLKLLAHPQRLQVIEFLEDRGDAPVHAIQEHIDLPHAATSQHLNQMKRAGLLRAERRGKEVWYAIAEPSSLTILDCIRSKRGGVT